MTLVIGKETVMPITWQQLDEAGFVIEGGVHSGITSELEGRAGCTVLMRIISNGIPYHKRVPLTRKALKALKDL